MTADDDSSVFEPGATDDEDGASDTRAEEGCPAPTKIENRAGLLHALTEAAELEHGLLLQYLFAALSMKKSPSEGITVAQAELVREWEGVILSVAREEMAHLGTVCNLLTAIGGAAHFGRPNFPVPSRYFRMESDGGSPRYVEFTLAPFSAESIARFVRFEAPEPPAAERALVEPELRYSTIGDLYRQIEAAFVELEDATLFIGPQHAQDRDDWSLGLRLWNVIDTQSAITAIRSIVAEGEATPTAGPASHFQRFQRIQRDLSDEVTRDPDFTPARPVVENPLTRSHFESPGGALIDDADACKISELFNAVYGTMILMLMQYYAFAGESEEQRFGLRAAIRQLMSAVIRPLGEVLTEIPAGSRFPGQTAGPSFELYTDLRLPAHQANAWTIFHERLAEEAEACARLSTEEGAPPRLRFLQQNLRLVARSVERHIRSVLLGRRIHTGTPTSELVHGA